MRQEHINAIQAAINELNPEFNPSGRPRLSILREAFKAFFEHCCQHEENHLVTGQDVARIMAERIAEDSNANVTIDQWSSSPEAPPTRNIEP